MNHIDLLGAFLAGILITLMWRWLNWWRWLHRLGLIIILLSMTSLLYSQKRSKLHEFLEKAKGYLPAPIQQSLNILNLQQHPWQQLRHLPEQFNAEQKQRLEQLERLEYAPPEK